LRRPWDVDARRRVGRGDVGFIQVWDLVTGIPTANQSSRRQPYFVGRGRVRSE
jgi:hypothetical protein